MTGLPSKRPRLRLDPKSYRRLHHQVLARDGWRCQNCGSLTDLQVHHLHPRGLLGDDAEANLITFCAKCHKDVHLQLCGAPGAKSNRCKGCVVISEG